jgi:16S rRNA (cytosine1402-N4)-methyltransferase
MGGGMSAAELIDESTEEELANLIYRYGEERQSRRIAKAIKNKMAEKPIQTTLELATLIEETIPRKWGDKIHPATRTFQALRVAVNDELGELERALEASVKILKPNGRLVVVTFHSLEDRIVKNFLKDHTSPQKAVNKYASESPEKDNHPFRLIQRKVLKASREEAIINSRARSAKLRSAIRTEVDS